MALVLKFNACVQTACTELVVKELTGVYNASTNTGGYGTPNPTTGDVLTAVLTVTSPSAQIYTINLFDNGFPSSVTTFEYVIPMSELGNRTEIEDGQWTFLYTITTDTDETYQVTWSKIFTCGSECCVAKLLGDLDITDCDCTDTTKAEDNYLKAFTNLQSLKYAAFCGNLTEYNKILNILSKLCTNTGCKSCN